MLCAAGRTIVGQRVTGLSRMRALSACQLRQRHVVAGVPRQMLAMAACPCSRAHVWFGPDKLCSVCCCNAPEASRAHACCCLHPGRATCAAVCVQLIDTTMAHKDGMSGCIKLLCTRVTSNMDCLLSTAASSGQQAEVQHMSVQELQELLQNPMLVSVTPVACLWHPHHVQQMLATTLVPVATIRAAAEGSPTLSNG